MLCTGYICTLYTCDSFVYDRCSHIFSGFAFIESRFLDSFTFGVLGVKQNSVSLYRQNHIKKTKQTNNQSKNILDQTFYSSAKF